MSGTTRITVAVYNEDLGWVLGEEYIDRIRSAAADCEVNVVASDSELIEHLPDTDWLIGCPLPAATLFEHARSLRFIQCTTIGDERLLEDPTMFPPELQVSLSSRIRAPQAAEHVLLLTLALLRNLPHHLDFSKESGFFPGWDASYPVTELAGLRVMLLTDPALRAAAGRLFRAFGCSINAPDLFRSNGGDNVVTLFNPDELDSMLTRTDVLVAALPPLVSFRGYLDRNRLSRLADSSILVNVGFPAALDESALVELLDKQRLRAAGLDGLCRMPLHKQDPLLMNLRVLVTPGVASSTSVYWERAVTVICSNIERLLTGQPLPDLVPAPVADE
ncbi:MAG TPA: hypothetical protein ENJ06_04440 [Phycisphaeraceae bacterium]|nr:hypothetical protein [Phycisphaeraceae bacterium]